MNPEPVELAALRERCAELSDLQAMARLLFWDQNTMMPAGGAPARGEAAATVEQIAHDRLIAPELGRLLERLEPHVATLDPDADDARLVAAVRRDHEKAVRVPSALAAEMARAQALGHQSWLEAREASDFGRFRDAMELHVELRHRYVACFETPAHPYDVLLDDFEPGMTTAVVQPLFTRLRAGLGPLIAAAGDATQRRNDGVFAGPHAVADQRRAVMAVLHAVGFSDDAWRLDEAAHPFAQSMSRQDIRLTTRYDEDDFGMALYSALHEFGHGLYEAGVDPALERTTLGEPVSLGVHESQSRLWENMVGRSRPFCAWALPRLRAVLPGRLDGLDTVALYRAVNSVQPSLIRVEADETTYNLHIVLRLELELALIEGRLPVAELPGAWNEGMFRLLGVEVPDDARGVLQDVHWGAGLIGYFPTYSLGNLIGAQLWEQARDDLGGDLDAHIAAGDFAPLRDWLREYVHRHGRKFPPLELLQRVAGEELRAEPFLAYLRAKLTDAGHLAAAAA